MSVVGLTGGSRPYKQGPRPVGIVAWRKRIRQEQKKKRGAGLEAEARLRKPAYAAARLGLARAGGPVSAAAVHGAARGVMDALAPPDGQERAHLSGRVAAAAA